MTDIIFNMQHTIMNTPNTPNTSDKTESEPTLDLQASPVPDHHQAAGSQLHQAEYVPTQTPTTREVHHLGRKRRMFRHRGLLQQRARFLQPVVEHHSGDAFEGEEVEAVWQLLRAPLIKEGDGGSRAISWTHQRRSQRVAAPPCFPAGTRATMATSGIALPIPQSTRHKMARAIRE